MAAEAKKSRTIIGKGHKSTSQKRTKRFLKNHALIQYCLTKRRKTQPGRITVQEIADDVGITKQGFYEHYHDVNQAIIEGEDELIEKFSIFIDSFFKNRQGSRINPNRLAFTALFIFMSRQKKLFYEISDAHVNEEILARMMEILYPKLQVTWLPKTVAAPEVGSEPIDIFIRIAVGIVCRWGTCEHCNYEHAEPYIRKLMRLADDASRRIRL